MYKCNEYIESHILGATCLELAWTQDPHIQTHDFSKWSHVCGCALAKIGLSGRDVLSRGQHKPPDIAQA
jgi:hypothetical protein